MKKDSPAQTGETTESREPASKSSQAVLRLTARKFRRKQKGMMRNCRFETKLESVESLLYHEFCGGSNSAVFFQNATFLVTNLPYVT